MWILPLALTVAWHSSLWKKTGGALRADEVCYENMGCFTDDRPWAGTAERPVARLPWSPERIAARYLLYTPQNKEDFQQISTDKDVIASSNYNPSFKTRFILHGFIDKGDEHWLSNMCKLMLSVEDVNCICVDWKKGSQTLYTQAASNIRVLGAEIAYMISIFKKRQKNVHVIGHSLGAHCAAEVGRRTPGLSRITALDPAEPYFQGCPELVRLDPSDAKFVDVIHSDALPFLPYLGFGMSQAVGHIDFYPNGGDHMPGCDKNIISTIVDLDGIWEGTRDFVACNHLRSYKYYSDSIQNPEGFVGYPCNDNKMFQNGQCFPCPNSDCPLMGHYADTFKLPSGGQKLKFFLNTGDARPFDRYRYKVTVTIDGSRTVTGYMKVALYGSQSNTRQYEVHSGFLKPGKTYDVFIDTDNDVGDIIYVKFIWNNNMINPLLPKFGATKILVTRGHDRREGTASTEPPANFTLPCLC
uniref:Triacylglycerol lipase n=1 Tax=Denticeps clupeoides TaxID=299321 RepID=A0AAY4EMN0_9TELE